MFSNSSSFFKKHVLIIIIYTFLVTSAGFSQVRSLDQDSTLNNLKHQEGVQTSNWNELGNVAKIGSGDKKMIFIPGLAFSAETYREFLESYQDEYTIYAVTLPGFGGTDPLPIKDKQPDFAQTPWLNSSIIAIEKLIQEESLEDILLMSHWSIGPQIAIKLALNQPEKFTSLILLSGVVKSYFETLPEMFSWSLQQREQYVNLMANNWFKTVTNHTWDDNNFMTYDYSVNPLRALFLWREAAKITLPVNIRYMLEFYSMDISEDIERLKLPILVIQPGFEDSDVFVDPPYGNYMKNLCIDSWKGISNENITFKKVSGTRLFIMYDNPEGVHTIIRDFITKG